ILNLSGSYTITVQGSSTNNPSQVGAYSFRLRTVPPDQRFTIAIGDRVTNGQPAPGAGNVETPGARDIYTFFATAGSQVYFEDLGSAGTNLIWTAEDPLG